MSIPDYWNNFPDQRVKEYKMRHNLSDLLFISVVVVILGRRAVL